MQDFKLMCNYKKCRKVVGQYAYITSCSHVFCSEHGVVAFNNDTKCPACSCDFQTRDEIVKIDLMPNDNAKSMMMAGFHPDTIIEIATKALAFWTYQITQECLYLQGTTKTAEENTELLRIYTENLSIKYKLEIQKNERKLDSITEELTLFKQRCEELVKQLSDKSRALSKLQGQYDNLKRSNLPTSFRNTDEYCDPPETRETEPVNVLPDTYPPMHPMARKQFANRNNNVTSGDNVGFERDPVAPPLQQNIRPMTNLKHSVNNWQQGALPRASPNRENIRSPYQQNAYRMGPWPNAQTTPYFDGMMVSPKNSPRTDFQFQPSSRRR